MGLRFNPKTREYFLMTKDDAAAREAGLTLSTKIRGPNGESVYFTNEAYAALPFYRQADENVAQQLQSMMSDYEKSWAIMSNSNYEVGQPDSPQRQNGLRPYQNAGVDYALAHQNCLIGDEMGIGKTATSIAVANTVGAKKVLVICPASIRLNWRKQIKLWSNVRHVRVYPILRGRDGGANYPHYTIISYELTRNPGIHAALRAIHWDVIIIDEAHFLKSHDAQRTQAIFGGHFSKSDAVEKIELRMSLAACADRIICLTGTPLPNRPRECFTLAKALCFSADTLLLTNRGPVPIVDVQQNDLLWDGEQWVSHGGVVFQGEKDVLRSAGVAATPEHTILANGQWITWSAVLGDESARSRALATGRESLQSWATFQAQVESAWSSSALAADGLTESHNPISFTAAHCDAKSAAIKCLDRMLFATREVRQTADCADCYCLEYPRSADDAKTQATEVISGTGSAASEFGHDGSSVGRNFSPTSPLYPTVASPATSLIEKTTQKDTSQEISGGSRSGSTHATNAASPSWNVVSESLRPVYDVVNAGPNRRFTILTDAGPLVVHNCWDAIDNLSFDEFCYRFNPLERISERASLMDGGSKTYVREEKGRLPELHARLRCNFMVRRLKKDVLKQLPEKQYEFAYIEPDGAIREAVKREKMLDFDIDDLINGRSPMEIQGMISTIRREMGEAKVPRAIEHIRYLLDIEEVDKLVLFSHHRSVMDALKAELAPEYGLVEVRGGMGSTAKENSVVQFQTNPKIRIFSGQLDAAGFGIDGLQNVASRMVFVEPAWVPGANDQAVDRLHRLGQAFPVWAQFLVVEGSLDERVLAAVLDKAYTINEVLDNRGTRV